MSAVGNVTHTAKLGESGGVDEAAVSGRRRSRCGGGLCLDWGVTLVVIGPRLGGV